MVHAFRKKDVTPSGVRRFKCDNVKESRLIEENKRILRAKTDLKEFDYLYRNYFPMINSFVFHRVEDEAVRHEIVSNVFFKAMKKLNLFRILDARRCTFSSWLFRIAVNEVNQYYRERKKRQKIDERLKWEGLPQPHEPLDFSGVKRVLERLSEEEQTLISLRYFEKRPIREVAQIVGKKESAIKVRLHRTLKKMRQMLDKEQTDEPAL